MKLITRFQLAALGRPELHALHREVSIALARSEPGSTARRTCLASLENIAAEIAARILCP